MMRRVPRNPPRNPILQPVYSYRRWAEDEERYNSMREERLKKAKVTPTERCLLIFFCIAIGAAVMWKYI